MQPVWLHHLGPRRELLELRELLRAVGVYVCGYGERNPPRPFSLATLTEAAVDVGHQRLFRQDRPRIHAHHVQDTASSVQHVRCSALNSSPTQPCLIYFGALFSECRFRFTPCHRLDPVWVKERTEEKKHPLNQPANEREQPLNQPNAPRRGSVNVTVELDRVVTV